MSPTIHTVGIIMNGVTGRMGTNQHLMRSIVEIIKQGGVKVSPSEYIMPDPVLVGRDGVFVSGQIALNPGDKELTGGTIEEQTEQAFANLRAILEEAGTGLDRLVKTTVFLQNFDDFQGMNSVYSKHVGETPPARSTVEVAKLPSGALVEIEAIALA